ncbi:hypothetical protein J6590_096909, partial [Homalodisca vitripennis]
ELFHGQELNLEVMAIETSAKRLTQRAPKAATYLILSDSRAALKAQLDTFSFDLR